MRVTDYIAAERVFVFEGPHTEHTFFEVLADRIQACFPPIDRDRLFACLAGERQTSTDLSSGVAICHAITEGLDEPTCIIVLIPAGVSFGQQEETKTRVAVLLLSPADKTMAHARILARLMRLVSTLGFAPRANEASRKDELYSIFVQEDGLHV